MKKAKSGDWLRGHESCGTGRRLGPAFQAQSADCTLRAPFAFPFSVLCAFLLPGTARYGVAQSTISSRARCVETERGGVGRDGAFLSHGTCCLISLADFSNLSSIFIFWVYFFFVFFFFPILQIDGRRSTCSASPFSASGLLLNNHPIHSRWQRTSHQLK